MNKVVTYRLLFFLVLLSITTDFSFGQFVTLANNGLEKCLVDNYSSLLNGQNELDTVGAKNLTGALNCSGKNIVNATDLKYFQGVSALELQNNEIVDLTPIAALTQLTSITITSNELEFVPDLTPFNSLKSFNANYNQLDNPPVFPTSIEEIRMGNNSLSGTLDFTGLSQLKTLSIFENDVKEMIGIENTALEYAKFYSNRLNIVKDYSSLTTLKHYDVRENFYSDLPLLFTSSLTFVGVANNSLTFEDLMPFSGINFAADSFPDFDLQEKQEASEIISIEEGDSWQWVLGFDQGITSNVYHWFKDGVEVETNTTGLLSLSNIELSDSGKYHCEVENVSGNLVGGTLYTNEKTLVITPKSVTTPSCFTIEEINVEVDSPPCQELAIVKIVSVTMGEVGTVNYTVNGTSVVNGEIKLEEEGLFAISVSDSNCTVIADKKVNVIFDINNCEPPSFSPNGDGLDDNYYLNYSGEALIYNKQGELIQKLQLPQAWDGRKLDNTLADTGLYVVIINGTTKVNLTLLR